MAPIQFIQSPGVALLKALNKFNVAAGLSFGRFVRRVALSPASKH
jgi:hypothetical protein